MESDPTRMCELLVGLPEVNVLGIDDVAGEPVRVHIEGQSKRPGCAGCGVFAHVKDRRPVELSICHEAGARCAWSGKARFRCPESSCPMGTWTEDDPRIASKRLMMTDRAGRWITEQVAGVRGA